MMSLVATPVVTARVTAPKAAARKTTMTVKAASHVNSGKSAAIAGAVSLTLCAQPALAAMELAYPVPAAQEIAMVADAGEDAAKKAKAKALALSLQSALVEQDAKEGKIVTAGNASASNPANAKVKQLAAPSLGGFSLPGGGGGSKAAPAAKAPKEAKAPSEGGVPILGLAMGLLFSPLILIGGFSLKTLLRVVPQAAEGKDFFPKDTLPF